MKHGIILLACACCFSTCNAQNQPTVPNIKRSGGPCEGCEAIYEYGNKKLAPTDTLPAYRENEPKIKITGTVFKRDGKTPAANIILYIYHTNRKGVYETRGNETGWAKRHGYIRGWIKTGTDGRFAFYTFRPAAYPNQGEPEHIHVILKEPGRNEYYIDDYHFDNDPLLTVAKRRKLPGRGGPGIVQPQTEQGILTVRRNIILGLNIPDYE